MSDNPKRLFPSLDLGVSRVVPYGGFSPESMKVWDRKNLVTRRGILRPAWKWTPLPLVQPTLHGHSESRTVAEHARDQAVLDALLVSSPDGSTRAYIVLTDGEIFINRESKNPTYTTAQTATLQSPGASEGVVDLSAAAALRSRGIKPGDLFRSLKMQGVSSDLWESVIAVTDQQTMRISRDGYAGEWDASWASTPQTWTVRRTFRRSTSMGRAYMALSNGDLFVACQCAGRDYSGVAASEWCVLRISNALTSPGEAEYILSTWDTTGSLQSKSIVPEIQEITGLQVSVDGRVVITTVEDGVSFNRVRYSANEDVTNWQDDPATWTDIQGATSKVFCLSAIGERFAAFTSDAIFAGIPTGVLSPPFAWVATRANVGTMWPRAVCRHPAGLVFLGTDGLPYLFDGEMARPLADETIKIWTSGVDIEYDLLVAGTTIDVLAESGPAAMRLLTVNPTVVIS